MNLTVIVKKTWKEDGEEELISFGKAVQQLSKVLNFEEFPETIDLFLDGQRLQTPFAYYEIERCEADYRDVLEKLCVKCTHRKVK
jgi:hypothetical protein